MLSAIVNQSEIPKWKMEPQWDMMYRTAEFHNVANMAYYAVLAMNGKKENMWRKKFEERYHRSVYSESRYKVALIELENLFETLRIHHLVLKDFLLPAYYPQRDMRYVQKVNIVVQGKDLERAEKILLELDYEKQESEVAGESLYYKIPGVRIALQVGIDFTNKKMKKYFADVLKDYPTKENTMFAHVFSEEDFYLYIICNAAESFARGILTIQDVVDMWNYYLKIYKKINFGYINKKLQDFEVENFHLCLIQLSAFWFGGMLFPEHDKIFHSMERYILSKGLRGRTHCAMILPLIEEVEIIYKNDMKRRRRKQAIEWFFPPAEYMDTLYPILKKGKFFLPACWVVRLVRIAYKFIAHRTYQIYVKLRARYIKLKYKVADFWQEKIKANIIDKVSVQCKSLGNGIGNKWNQMISKFSRKK